MAKIKTIILKEWAEVFKNRFVLFTVAFLPLIMTAIPIAILVTLRGEAGLGSVSSEMPAQFTAFSPAGLARGAGRKNPAATHPSRSSHLAGFRRLCRRSLDPDPQ